MNFCCFPPFLFLRPKVLSSKVFSFFLFSVFLLAALGAFFGGMLSVYSYPLKPIDVTNFVYCKWS